jgi:hypothetical protein
MTYVKSPYAHRVDADESSILHLVLAIGLPFGRQLLTFADSADNTLGHH